MKSEDPVLRLIEKTPTDETEIGDVFFIPAAPNLAPVPPADDGQTRLTDVFFLFDAVPESGIAEPEDFSQYTVARHFRAASGVAVAQSKSMALRAGFFRQSDRFRAIPFDVHECSFRLSSKNYRRFQPIVSQIIQVAPGIFRRFFRYPQRKHGNSASCGAPRGRIFPSSCDITYRRISTRNISMWRRGVFPGVAAETN